MSMMPTLLRCNGKRILEGKKKSEIVEGTICNKRNKCVWRLLGQGTKKWNRHQNLEMSRKQTRIW